MILSITEYDYHSECVKQNDKISEISKSFEKYNIVILRILLRKLQNILKNKKISRIDILVNTSPGPKVVKLKT